MATKEKKESKEIKETKEKKSEMILADLKIIKGYYAKIDGREFREADGTIDISDLTREQERQLFIAGIIKKK